MSPEGILCLIHKIADSNRTFGIARIRAMCRQDASICAGIPIEQSGRRLLLASRIV